MTTAFPSYLSVHDGAPAPVTTGRMIERLGSASVLTRAGVQAGVPSTIFRRSTFVPHPRDRVLMWGATAACALSATLLVAGVALVR
jgi:hypothetical protein